MKVHIQHILSYITTSFWCIPSLLAILGLLAGYGAQKLDLALYENLSWTLTDPAGARAILTTVAASSITVAGVVFSITMVVLSSASSQFGPRLMRNFLRHIDTKVVLGGYIGIFIYCMMVVATVRDGENGWVPQLSVTIGGILGLLSFGLLIAFIHHVTHFLQASKIINEVAEEIDECSNKIFPLNALTKDSEFSTTIGTLPEVDEHSRPIIATKKGYLKSISLASILTKSVKNNAIIRYHHRPGEYILENDPIATVWCSEEDWENISEDINASITTGSERTELQDIEYAIDQLVEVAVRAMSKGINDPFTAINCIHRLASALLQIAHDKLPGSMIHDANGKLRIATVSYTYPGLIDAAFHQIRQNAKPIEAVSIEFMHVLSRLSHKDTPNDFHASIERHSNLLMDDCNANFENDSDLEDLKNYFDQRRQPEQ